MHSNWPATRTLTSCTCTVLAFVLLTVQPINGLPETAFYFRRGQANGVPIALIKIDQSLAFQKRHSNRATMNSQSYRSPRGTALGAKFNLFGCS